MQWLFYQLPPFSFLAVLVIFCCTQEENSQTKRRRSEVLESVQQRSWQQGWNRHVSVAQILPASERQWRKGQWQQQDLLEMPGIEPGASYMQSMRSTTELHPHSEHCDSDQRNETGISSFANKVFVWQRLWTLMKSLDKMYSNNVEPAHERVMSH